MADKSYMLQRLISCQIEYLRSTSGFMEPLLSSISTSGGGRNLGCRRQGDGVHRGRHPIGEEPIVLALKCNCMVVVPTFKMRAACLPMRLAAIERDGPWRDTQHWR